MKVECENWRVRVEIPEDECCRVRAGGTITKREALPNNAKVHVFCSDRDKVVDPYSTEDLEKSRARSTQAIISSDCDVELLIPYGVLADRRISASVLSIGRLEFNPPELRHDFEKRFPDAEIRIEYGGSVQLIHLTDFWYTEG